MAMRVVRSARTAISPVSKRTVSLVPRIATTTPTTTSTRPLSLGAGNSHQYRPAFHVKWDPKWIDEEAERIMTKAYNRHNSLGDRSTRPRPAPTKEELDTPLMHVHYPAKGLGDHFAYYAVNMLKPLTHAFFRDKYNHHAVVLETVAAVPGMVGGMFRHLRSLRRMTRDNGWIHPLWEEAENERMHLLIWMKVTSPTPLEKALVLAAQGFYTALYATMYLFAPSVAHRFVGYLEEEAVAAYTGYLKALDQKALPNLPAPDIAKFYYKLPEDATIRDVVLYVRQDECMHRCLNHKFADLHKMNLEDHPPDYPTPVADEDPAPAAPTPHPSKTEQTTGVANATAQLAK